MILLIHRMSLFLLVVLHETFDFRNTEPVSKETQEDQLVVRDYHRGEEVKVTTTI